MNVVTAPKKLIQNGRFIIVPKEEYKEFSLWKKAVRVQLNEEWFWTPEWQKKEAEADEAIRTDKIIGPFSDYKKMAAALKKK